MDPGFKVWLPTLNVIEPAKLIRIAWAVLFYGEKFDIHRAGVPRSVLAAMAGQSSNEDAAAA